MGGSHEAQPILLLAEGLAAWIMCKWGGTAAGPALPHSPAAAAPQASSKQTRWASDRVHLRHECAKHKHARTRTNDVLTQPAGKNAQHANLQHASAARVQPSWQLNQRADRKRGGKTSLGFTLLVLQPPGTSNISYMWTNRINYPDGRAQRDIIARR